MPTVLLLDTSLSMLAAVSGQNGFSTHRLAVSGIKHFVEWLSEDNNSNEQTALIYFSDEATVVVPFTCDYSTILTVVSNDDVEVRSRTRLSPALTLAHKLCLSTWGRNTFCKIVVLTDGQCLEALNFVQDRLSLNISDFSLPFAFPSAIHFILLSVRSNSNLSLPFYSQLCKANNQLNYGECISLNASPTIEGIHLFDVLTFEDVNTTFDSVISSHYAKFDATLICGTLKTAVVLIPPPSFTHRQLKDFEVVGKSMSDEIEILGFIKPSDLSHAPIIARHLVLAASSRLIANEKSTPSLCVLLHGSLKVEDMVALCLIGEDWYGILHVLSDNAKKSNLVLNCFEPGIDAVPWLGNLSDLRVKHYDETKDVKISFPVQQKEKCSYFTSSQQQNLLYPCWIQNVGLQADLQKVLRYVRKLPERQFQFYQELNRLCSHALAIGFTGLLVDTLVALLEKEKITAQTNPEAAKHLTHAISALKSKALTFGDPISPPP